MITDAFEVEKAVISALGEDGVTAITGTELDALRQFFAEPTFAAHFAFGMTPGDVEIISTLICQRDAAEARIAQLERERSILATRCYEQSQTIQRMLERRQDAPADPHPIVTAIEAMQRGGIR
jgi:hypothetical protein